MSCGTNGCQTGEQSAQAANAPQACGTAAQHTDRQLLGRMFERHGIAFGYRFTVIREVNGRWALADPPMAYSDEKRAVPLLGSLAARNRNQMRGFICRVRDALVLLDESCKVEPEEWWGICGPEQWQEQTARRKGG